MGFISCRSRLTKVLAGAARGGKGSKSGGGRVRLSNVHTGELAEFNDELMCSFILVANIVGGGIREFVALFPSF